MSNYSKLIALSFKEQTPFLAFDKEIIKSNLNFLKTCENENQVKFLMAVKSFPHPEILKMVSAAGLGFDFSNLNEVKLVESRDTQSWLTDPSGLSSQFAQKVDHLLSTKTVLTVSSLHELQLLVDKNFKPARPLSLALRLSTSTLGKTSRFGLDVHNWKVAAGFIHQLVSERKISWMGVHFQHGSEKNNFKTYETLLAHALEFAQTHSLDLPNINFGGGLHFIGLGNIPMLITRLRQCLPEQFKTSTFVFEPGRLLSENAGFAVAKVLNSRPQFYQGEETLDVAVDLSAVCHLNWTKAEFLPINIYGRENEKNNLKMMKLSFYGPTCYEGDLIGEFLANNLFELKTDDLVFFSQVSGYAYALNRSFNGIEKANIHFF